MKLSKPGEKFSVCTFLLIAGLSISCTRDTVISLKSLLTEMTDRRALTLYPEPYYRLKQFSSYDRETKSPDLPGWFANADYTQFSGIDTLSGRTEYILLDAGGPGAIVRWWMTFAGEKSHDGTIRVYIDNNRVPVIEDNVLKVISGNLLSGEPLSTSVSPETDILMRGHNLYLPLPFAKQCRITYECDAIVSGRKPSIYYNICCRLYDNGTKVVSFSKEEHNYAAKLIEDINRRLLNPWETVPEPVSIKRVSDQIDPGNFITLQIKGRNRAISRLILKLSAPDYPQALRSTVIKIVFDNHQTVWVPAGEFFGTGYKRSVSETWFSKVDTAGTMSSFWLMPFREKCSIELINYGRKAVEADLSAEISEYRWNSRTLYFGASWHEYHNITGAGVPATGGTGNHTDLNFADIRGSGVYAGDAITVFNTADAWFGEGDEKIFVDGEEFPSSIGTGTEDYYGYAWCRPEVFSHPFIAQPSGEGNFHPGQSINIRYRSLDAIPFRSSVSSNIELWHWTPTVINYAVTAYWYVKPGYTINIEPRPESVSNPVALSRTDVISPSVDSEGTIEGENLEEAGLTGGIAEIQYSGRVDWSNKSQLWWHGGNPGDTLNLKFVMPARGRFKITASLTRAADYGMINFLVNGQKSGVTFNGYIPSGVETRKVILGTFDLKRGINMLSVIIAGSDKRAKPGNMAGIDYLYFEPAR